MKSFLLLFAFVAVFAAVAVAEEGENKELECYSCNSMTGDNKDKCANADDLTDEMKVECTGKNPACIKSQGEQRKEAGKDLEEFVTRGCVQDTKATYMVEPTDECVYGDGFGGAYGTQCMCTESECNASSALQTSVMAVVSLLVLAVITH